VVILKGISVLSSETFFFVIWDLKGQWGLIGFSLVLLFGLMKVDIYIFGDNSNIMT
jgi:hypothetical protein